jgi:hypothetical protein
MQQPQLSFTDSIIARYGFPTDIQMSMKNSETLVFTVPDANAVDKLLDDEHLQSMVQVASSLNTPYILVKRIDDRRYLLTIRTRSLTLLLERTS